MHKISAKQSSYPEPTIFSEANENIVHDQQTYTVDCRMLYRDVLIIDFLYNDHVYQSPNSIRLCRILTRFRPQILPPSVSADDGKRHNEMRDMPANRWSQKVFSQSITINIVSFLSNVFKIPLDLDYNSQIIVDRNNSNRKRIKNAPTVLPKSVRRFAPEAMLFPMHLSWL